MSKMTSRLITFAILFCFCGSAKSHKILVISPMPARSHNIIGRGIADTLHDAKHEITFVTAFPQEKSRFREIAVTETLNALENVDTSFEGLSKTSTLDVLFILSTLVNETCEEMYGADNFKKLLNDKNEKFDLVVVECFLYHGLAGLGVKYDCPVIFVSSLSLTHWLARFTGNPVSPSTIPNSLSNFNSEMTFQQRVINTVMAVIQEVAGPLYNDRNQEVIYKKYLPAEAERVPFSDLHKNVALTLSNSHPSLGNVRPLLPNTIEICGFHIQKAKPLSDEYKKILDNAKNGVIFFSMGSNIKSSDMPAALKAEVLVALSKRKELILWKYEEDLPNKPNNVIIRSWMPQASILTHPNVKLFITHGGFLSTTEAAAAGVPVLCIPIFCDQFMNAQITQDRGTGILLQYTNLTESSLTWALDEVLGNHKYAETAKKTHQLFHDRPIKPRELVSFYVDHVIRTGGAKHLSAPHIPLHSLLLLDVIAVLIIPPLILVLIVIWMCRKMCNSKSRNKVQPKHKKN